MELLSEPGNRQVIFVLGPAYCGSTLLNYQFDALPGVLGLSEAINWFRDPPVAMCLGCKTAMQRCRNFERYRLAPDFYERWFADNPEITTLVNTSKVAVLCWYKMPKPPEGVTSRVLLLTKQPHEFAWSMIQHERAGLISSGTVSEALDRWAEICMSTYEIVRLTAEGKPTKKAWSAPPLTLDSIKSLTYRDIVTDPAAALQPICQAWGITFDAEGVRNPWGRKSTTCAVGGNFAAASQVLGNFKETVGRKDYLDGKYEGQEGKLFLDRAWTRNVEFLRLCLELYASNGRSSLAATVAENFGHPPRDRLIGEVTEAYRVALELQRQA